MKSIPTNSVHFNIHSPPFAALYIYSDSEADMGNCASDEEFFAHYRFAINEMFRVTVPGRLVAVHCKDLPKYANVWGTTGLIDFPGACIQEYEEAGWVFHSRITIWKCPVTERERTNNNGLLHKTVIRDSSQLRQGMADYLILFRKPPSEGKGLMSDIPIKRFEKISKVNGKGETVTTEKPIGFSRYVGAVHYQDNDNHPSQFARKTKASNPSIDIWRRYAEPVWWDINQTRVLNHKLARGDGDEKHICLAKGTPVLTKRDGYKPIQEVKIGDEVWTHNMRWRRVIAKQKTGINPVVEMSVKSGQTLLLTPTHKVYAYKRPEESGRYHADFLEGMNWDEPEWIEAKDSVGSKIVTEYNSRSEILSVEPAGESETWNLRVLEDESFTAKGCVVKNCPLQLDVIERAIEIWSLEDEIVLSPFSGVGSEGVGAVSSGRRFLGVELKTEYFNHSVSELTAAEKEFKRKLLF